MSDLCPCGSNIDFAQCCQQYIDGKQPADTPEKLMRSRYSAYVLKRLDYLLATWHPDCQAHHYADNLQESFSHTHWLALRIIESAPGRIADEGFVEFSAKYQENNHPRAHLLHERSRFLRINQQWYYVDGIYPKTRANELCPCGLGKKYKKCCGQGI